MIGNKTVYFAIWGAFLLFVAVPALGFMGYLLFADPWTRAEAGRIAAPVGAIEAVIYQWSAAGTDSLGHEIQVVRRGEAPPRRAPMAAYLFGAVREDGQNGVDLTWDGADTLVVGYRRARGVRLEQPTVAVDGITVRVVLRGGAGDATGSSDAPQGRPDVKNTP